MKSKMKRFLMLLMLLALLMSAMATVAFAEEAADSGEEVTPVAKCYVHGDVNSDGKVNIDDARRVLMHIHFGELYPVSQDCEFDGEEGITIGDALYLLSHEHFPDTYPLRGVIHAYYEPTWEWTQSKDGSMVAKITYGCTCSNGTKVYSSTDENSQVTITVQTTEPGCVQEGKNVYTATYGEESSTYTQAIPAVGENGHKMNGTQSCESGSNCENCDFVLEPLGHNWVLNAEKSTASTCQGPGKEVYTCSRCGKDDEKVLELSDDDLANLHQMKVTETVVGCTHTTVIACVVDGCEESTTHTYDNHSYTATLITPATCSAEGLKTYTCTNVDCESSYTEAVPVNDAHSWDAGTLNAEKGVTEYVCQLNNAHKKSTVTVAETGAVSKAAVAGNELAVNNDGTTMKISDALAGTLKEDIVVGVQTVNKADLGLSADKLAQIPANASVYDFTLKYSGGSAVEVDENGNFAGSITISLPYTVQPGDDINNINVWYIDGQNNLKSIAGTYNNGVVTFTTNHFSLYTVTELTGEQRCDMLGGHVWKEEYTAPTCAAEGSHIKICTRCGKDDSIRQIQPLGHSFGEDTGTAATCTEAGTTQKTCTTCGYSYSAAVPATGHVYDEKSTVAATCTAPGKETYTCSKCHNASFETETPQLGHTWAMHTRTVAATCTAPGRVEQYCETEGCDYAETLWETAVKGHIYPKATAEWTWAADHSSATVTMTCAECAQQETLRAVVTKGADTATCTAGGKVIYTAVASYNNTQYRADPVEIETKAAGHKPGTDWQTSATKHYYTCSKCDAALNEVSHSWTDEKVISEATCVRNGSATHVCADCGYEATKVLNATGSHTFVDGACTGCELKETTECSHVRTYEIPLDLSAYNVCAGAELYWEKCDCGEINKLLVENLECDFVTNESEETLSDGTSRITITETCVDCDLKIVTQSDAVVDQTACTYTVVVSRTVYYAGAKIAEATFTEFSDSHPTRTVETSEDMAQHGLCGGYIMIDGCYCGAHRMIDMYTEMDCEWQWNVDTQQYFCPNCDAVYISQYESKNEGCSTKSDGVFTFFNAQGTEVYSAQTHFENSESHMAMQMVGYKPYGKSCEDGLLITLKCECGYTYEYFTVGHVAVEEEVVDISEYGMCDATTMTISTCACEEEFTSVQIPHYQWEWVRAEEQNDGQIYIQVQRCSTCGVEKTETRVRGERDKNCECVSEITTVYACANGKTLTTEEKERESVHNWQTKTTLLGKSCEEGVEYTEYCTDCPAQYTSNYTGHRVEVQQRIDLEPYGLCGGFLTQTSCACTENSGMFIEDDQCSWEHVEGGQGWFKQKCTVCGTIRTEQQQTMEALGNCQVDRLRTVIIERDGEELLTMTLVCHEYEHREVWTFETEEGFTDCTQGYIARGHCIDCGETFETEKLYEHSHWALSYEQMTNGELCGEIHVAEMTCACGKETNTWLRWIGGECQFTEPEWDDAEQASYRQCVECSAKQKWYQEIIPIEGGEKCVARQIQHEEYINEYGQTIFDLVNDEVSPYHRRCVANFVLPDGSALPENFSCDQGYIIQWVCIECGEVDGMDMEPRYGCEPHAIDMKLLYDGTGLCSEVFLYTEACACGEQQNAWIGNDCWFDWLSYDYKTETTKLQCRKCGALQMNKHQSIYNQENCSVEVGDVITYYQNGELLTTLKETYEREQHTEIATFSGLNGETTVENCTDGYQVHYTCAYCDDYSRTEECHPERCESWFVLAYYDVSKIDMCDGGFVQMHDCACGKNPNVGWNLMCENVEWLYNSEDPQVSLRYCKDCETYIYEGRSSDTVYENCQAKGTYVLKFVRKNADGEDVVVADYSSYFVNGEEHDWIRTGVVGSGTCGEECTVAMKCAQCGKKETRTYQPTEEWFHYTDATAILYLNTETTCGGKIRAGNCICGKGEHNFVDQAFKCNRENMSHSQKDVEVDGVMHTYVTEICGDCGMKHEIDLYSVQDAITGCKNTRYEVHSYTDKNGTELGTFSQSYEEQTHAHTYTYALKTEGTSCEAGVIRTGTCAYCETVVTDEIFGHEQGVLDTVEVTTGCVNGVVLEKFGCACGEYTRYDVGENLAGCDLTQEPINCWIENAMQEGSQTTTTMNNESKYSSAWQFTCTCGFKMRMAEYWLWDQANCYATEYQVWEAYNATTGDYEAIMPEIITGSGQHHKYTESQIEDYAEDGTLVRRGVEQTCSTCNSYSLQIHEAVDETGLHYSEWITVNIRYETNGDDREHRSRSEYGFYANNLYYQTMDRSEFVRADGSETWNMSVYSDYQFGVNGECTRTRVQSDSTGWSYTQTENACNGEWKYEQTKAPTCTEPGEYNSGYICAGCGADHMDNYGPVEPLGHCYCESDPDTNVVGCCRCDEVSAA